MNRETLDLLKDLRVRYPFLPEKQIQAKAEKLKPNLKKNSCRKRKIIEKNRLKFKSIKSIRSVSKEDDAVIVLCSSPSDSERNSPKIMKKRKKSGEENFSKKNIEIIDSSKNPISVKLEKSHIQKTPQIMQWPYPRIRSPLAPECSSNAAWPSGPENDEVSPKKK